MEEDGWRCEGGGWKGKTSYYSSFLSQFRRSFPGPADVSHVQVSLLIKRYLDPATGLCNYLRFHGDVVAVGGAQTARNTDDLSALLPLV